MFSETGLDSRISDQLRKDIEKFGNNDLSYRDLKKRKEERKENFENNKAKLSEYSVRYWIRNKDKEMYLDFNEEYRRKIRDYFNSLDSKGSGSIGIEELEEPLITLGIAKGKNEVKKIMDEIDEDGSGEIEFGEFLQILKGKTSIYGDQTRNESNKTITEFFKSKFTPSLLIFLRND
jgi:Ca2+-binding EF-hand superfamily protein